MHATAANLPLDAYDLIFIDDSLAVEERAATIRAVARGAPRRALVVIHDFEQPLYQQAASSFAQRFCFSLFNPHTGVAWNIASVSPRQLQQLRSVIARNAATIEPDARHEWVALLRDSRRGAL